MRPKDWNTLGFLERIIPEFQSTSNESSKGICIHKLEWDSVFFQSVILKLEFLPDDAGITDLISQINLFYSSGERAMVFAEVPTNATTAIRTLGEAGFSMVETRLTYYHTLTNLQAALRTTRLANNQDLQGLKNSAAGAVNSFDRYHTDPFFEKGEAELYLETYISNCLNGFARAVFVPDSVGVETASFAALSEVKFPETSIPGKIFRIPLTACLPENRGWHYHLCLAAMHYAAKNNGLVLVMTTQAANQAVIHNCEKLGFKLGSTFHIFSKTLK